MDKALPLLHRELGFTFWWDKQKLWHIDLPIVEMNVEDFLWYLELPFWSDGGESMTVTPLEIVSDRETYRRQYERTISADLAYPINAIYINDRWLVMDG